MKRKRDRRKELKVLIEEQEKELSLEKTLVRYKGGKKGYSKGGRGIYVGNRIF